MDQLDQLFRENRASFDRLAPKANSWDAIQAKLPQQKKHKRYLLLKFAAVIVLLIGLVTFFSQNFNKNQFDDIALNAPDGQIIPLDPAENKLTLVHFWESGNLLCTEENCYYYLPAYEKYKDKGFEIYAISLDKDKESWVQGIEENHLPWIHVSDLKGRASPICIECNITKVPTSFLLDQDGEIIARDLDAKLLEQTLHQYFAKNVTTNTQKN